jgi:hypothetical protein
MWFALIALVSAALVFVHQYVTGFDPLGATARGPFLARALAAVSAGWIPAAMLAAAIALFSAARSLRTPIVGLAALVVVFGVTLVGGSLLLASPSVADRMLPVGIPESRMIRAGSLRIYAVRREALILEPLVYQDVTATAEPGFGVVPQAAINPIDGELIIVGSPSRTVDLSQFDNSYAAMAGIPAAVTPLVRDLGSFSDLLTLSDGARGPVLINLLAVILFVLSLWSLARLTKWPLFNMLFVLGALRFAIWLVPAIQTGALRDLFLGIVDSAALPLASAAVLGAFGVACFAILVFLPPMSEWRREVLGE